MNVAKYQIDFFYFSPSLFSSRKGLKMFRNHKKNCHHHHKLAKTNQFTNCIFYIFFFFCERTTKKISWNPTYFRIPMLCKNVENINIKLEYFFRKCAKKKNFFACFVLVEMFSFQKLHEDKLKY